MIAFEKPDVDDRNRTGRLRTTLPSGPVSSYSRIPHSASTHSTSRSFGDGEGATRTGSAELAPVNAYIRGDQFDLAAFKGQKVTFRSWDGQLRQPIIVAGPDLPVSMSPQEGFLHPKFLTDTLGYDEPETKCKFSK